MSDKITRKDKKQFMEAIFIDQLYDIASKGENSSFQFIRSMNGMLAAKALKRIFKRAVAGFSRLIKFSIKRYRKFIAQDDYINGFDEILLISELRYCLAYFKKELDLVKYELSEFRCFLNSGNWTKCLLGYVRSDQELFNYLEAPIKTIGDE